MSTFTIDQVRDVLNAVVNDIEQEAELAETGAIDAMNLVVNATIHYLENPSGMTLEAAIEAQYESEFEEVISWLES